MDKENCCHPECSKPAEWQILGKTYCNQHKKEGIRIVEKAKRLRRQADELDGGLKCPACNDGWTGEGSCLSSCSVCFGEGRLKQN